ncbi:hypothetical protein GCM10027282_15190 [Frigoribacterium salinisoli]
MGEPDADVVSCEPVVQPVRAATRARPERPAARGAVRMVGLSFGAVVVLGEQGVADEGAGAGREVCSAPGPGRGDDRQLAGPKASRRSTCSAAVPWSWTKFSRQM